jgi:hypothetical protein
MRLLIAALISAYAAAAQAEIRVPDHPPCQLETAEIKTRQLTDGGKRLSYSTVEGRQVLIAEANRGDYLDGRTPGSLNSDDISYDQYWVDIREMQNPSTRGGQPKTLDRKIVYLPLRHVLTPRDLGLNDDWSVLWYAMDYNRHTEDFSRKVFQFGVKNKKDGRTNTIIAADVEKKLLAKCGLKYKPNEERLRLVPSN